MSCYEFSFSWKASKSRLSYSASARISYLNILHSSYCAVDMSPISVLSSVLSIAMKFFCNSSMLETCLEITVQFYFSDYCDYDISFIFSICVDTSSSVVISAGLAVSFSCSTTISSFYLLACFPCSSISTSFSLLCVRGLASITLV